MHQILEATFGNNTSDYFQWSGLIVIIIGRRFNANHLDFPFRQDALHGRPQGKNAAGENKESARTQADFTCLVRTARGY